MAQLNLFEKGRIAASSILEVVVSMVIIIMVLGISLMIYTNVMRQSLSVRELKAQFLLNQALQQARTQPEKTTQVIDGWQIEQESIAYEAENNLWCIHLTAYDQDHNRVADTRQIVIRSSHE